MNARNFDGTALLGRTHEETKGVKAFTQESFGRNLIREERLPEGGMGGDDEGRQPNRKDTVGGSTRIDSQRSLQIGA